MRTIQQSRENFYLDLESERVKKEKYGRFDSFLTLITTNIYSSHAVEERKVILRCFL